MEVPKLKPYFVAHSKILIPTDIPVSIHKKL